MAVGYARLWLVFVQFSAFVKSDEIDNAFDVKNDVNALVGDLPQRYLLAFAIIHWHLHHIWEAPGPFYSLSPHHNAGSLAM